MKVIRNVCATSATVDKCSRTELLAFVNNYLKVMINSFKILMLFICQCK